MPFQYWFIHTLLEHVIFHFDNQKFSRRSFFLSFFVSSQFFFHNCVQIMNCLHSCFGRMLFASHLFIGLCTLLLSRYWVHIKCDKLMLLGSSCSKLPWQRVFWKCMMRFLNRHSVILSTVYAFYCTSEGKDYVCAVFGWYIWQS